MLRFYQTDRRSWKGNVDFAGMRKGSRRMTDLPVFDKLSHDDIVMFRRVIMDMVQHHKQIQRVRMALDNQFRAYDATVRSRLMMDKLLDLRDAIAALEMTLYAHICDAVLIHPVSEWALGVPGVGPLIVARLIASIPMDSENDFVTFSKLRKYAGICPGHDRRIKGQKLAYNPETKTTLFLAGFAMRTNRANHAKLDAHLKPHRLYIEIFDSWFDKYQQRNAQLPASDRCAESHLVKRALRKMLDVFLCHFWQVLRETSGFSVRPLYVHDHLGHQFMYRHVDFSNHHLALRNITRLQALVKRTFGNKSKPRKVISELATFFRSLQQQGVSIDAEGNVGDLKS